jgi:hypothetical protein
MKIEMSITGFTSMELTLDDFLNAKLETGTPEIRFVRNDTHVGCHKYPSVEVTAIIDGIPRMQHALNVYHHLSNYDPSSSVYQFTRFDLFIHYINNPKYDVKIQMERRALADIEIFNDANLLEMMIYPILDIVDQIINYNWMVLENYQIGFSDMFSIFKAILIGIAKNPNLASQIENMLVTLSLEQKEKYLQEKYMRLCIAICETIHTSTQLYEIYKCISTPMRAKLIEHFLNENKPDIVAQLTHFSNPINIEDIANDDRWTL